MSNTRAVAPRAQSGKRVTTTTESPLAGPPSNAEVAHAPNTPPSQQAESAHSSAIKEAHQEDAEPDHEHTLSREHTTVRPDVLAAALALLAEGPDLRTAHPEAVATLLRYEQVLGALLADLAPGPQGQ